MEIKKCVKNSFSVIGKEGSTKDGEDFIQKLWADANSNFAEVASMAKKDEKGNFLEYGVQCQIYPAHSIPGKIISPKGFTSQVLKLWIMLKHHKGG